ncbi:nuclear polyadenylated RNA-binding protein NAB2-like [Drosophila ananassae]|uniref:nuclear polyadenylated RNA-binding protein NAB2-like n=1 Tax=Drosophila ananassae TaxID=7217 RepID=UPI0013A5F22E|nr:nuclear polyadenylated RNA-binding protein NAB2-like [Drosophila ananassae]
MSSNKIAPIPQPQPHAPRHQQKPQDQPQPHAQPAPQLEHQYQPKISPSPTPSPRPSSSPSPIPKTSASSTPNPQNQPQDQPKPQPRICGGNFAAIGSKCYYIEKDKPQEWIGAIYECSRLGGRLAKIKNRQELDDISKELKPKSEYFVDINCRKNFSHIKKENTEKPKPGSWGATYVVRVINSFGQCGSRIGYSNKLFVCEKHELTQEQKQDIKEQFQKIGEKYYYIDSTGPVLWSSAFRTCQRKGGHLASPSNELELTNLSKELQPGLQYLIDLNDYLVKGQFMAVTSGSKTYTSWAAGEPNMEFGFGNVVIEKTELGAHMRHVKAKYEYPFICEVTT